MRLLQVLVPSPSWVSTRSPIPDRPTLINILILDTRLFECLRQLIKYGNDHYEFCLFAYHFRFTTSRAHLSHKIDNTANPGVWSLIRHYIGRLGSWFKASGILVRFCQRSPHILHDFCVELVSAPKPILAPKAEEGTELRAVLERMLPKYDSTQLEQVLQRSQAPGSAKIANMFSDKFAAPKFQPRIHVELVLLEHFHSRNLEFLRQDRYIGCSKASCYCCGLYMKHHPGRYESRPCHGNVWVKWSAPVSSLENDDSTQLTRAILKSMTKDMQKDLEYYVLSGPRWRRKMPDSTTAISTTIPR